LPGNKLLWMHSRLEAAPTRSAPPPSGFQPRISRMPSILMLIVSFWGRTGLNS